MKNQSEIFCNWCGRQTYLIFVHGHGQCAFCKTNIDECCRGEIYCNSNNSNKNNTPGNKND